MSFTSNNIAKSALPMFDTMLQMQQLGLRAMSMYGPVVSAFLNTTKAVEREAHAAGFRTTPDRMTNLRDMHDANEEQVVSVGEEVLNVGTRMVAGKTTRVRRVVVETPVQQDVTLHTETVVLEHRKPLQSTGDVLTELTVEMSDFSEVPVISKSVRLVEEVLLRKDVTARIETIHDTVRRDTLEIELPPSQLPVVFNAAAKQDEKRRDERRAAELVDKKPVVTTPPTDNKPGAQQNESKRT